MEPKTHLYRIMADVSREAGIAQSIIAKGTGHLISLGPVERCRHGSGKKALRGLF